MVKSKISCKSHTELADYLDELCVYFQEFSKIPLEEKESVPLPGDGVMRIRFDQNQAGGSIKITVDW